MTYENDNGFAKEIIYCGIGQYESLLHFGACDENLFFLPILDEFGLDIQYTAVDVKDEVKKLFTDFEPLERTNTWISHQESMQEFIDNMEDERYTWTLLTGVFNKPLYSERQYQFIDTVIKKCLEFSDNVIFTINENADDSFKYSMIYLYSHFTNAFESVTVKKIGAGKYIFHIKN